MDLEVSGAWSCKLERGYPWGDDGRLEANSKNSIRKLVYFSHRYHTTSIPQLSTLQLLLRFSVARGRVVLAGRRAIPIQKNEIKVFFRRILFLDPLPSKFLSWYSLLPHSAQ